MGGSTAWVAAWVAALRWQHEWSLGTCASAASLPFTRPCMHACLHTHGAVHACSGALFPQHAACPLPTLMVWGGDMPAPGSDDVWKRCRAAPPTAHAQTLMQAQAPWSPPPCPRAHPHALTYPSCTHAHPGSVANYAETEQLLTLEDGAQAGATASYVIVRGSIPLLWTQLPNLKYKPTTVIAPSEMSAPVGAGWEPGSSLGGGEERLTPLPDLKCPPP